MDAPGQRRSSRTRLCENGKRLIPEPHLEMGPRRCSADIDQRPLITARVTAGICGSLWWSEAGNGRTQARSTSSAPVTPKMLISRASTCRLICDAESAPSTASDRFLPLTRGSYRPNAESDA